MPPDQWEAFLNDVQENGVKDPIVVPKGGYILNGRHRWLASMETGQETISARVVDWTPAEQVAYIYWSALLHRHLSDDQRAMVAVLAQEIMSKTAREERARKAGQAGGRGRAKGRDSSEDTASSKLSGEGGGTRKERSRAAAARQAN